MSGYDRKGYNTKGIDRAGFDREGLDGEGPLVVIAIYIISTPVSSVFVVSRKPEPLTVVSVVVIA
jgi:hypothetical protein